MAEVAAPRNGTPLASHCVPKRRTSPVVIARTPRATSWVCGADPHRQSHRLPALVRGEGPPVYGNDLQHQLGVQLDRGPDVRRHAHGDGEEGAQAREEREPPAVAAPMRAVWRALRR